MRRLFQKLRMFELQPIVSRQPKYLCLFQAGMDCRIRHQIT
nr:hypothetical protein [Serratia proteamaculans]